MEEEVRLIKERQGTDPMELVEEIVTKEDVILMQEQVREVYVDDRILEYISQIVNATRNHELVTLGVSPRGTLALMDMSRAMAYMSGRNYVLPEDVKNVAEAVLAHRMLVNGKARMSHVDSSEIVREILDKTEAPKIKPVL